MCADDWDGLPSAPGKLGQYLGPFAEAVWGRIGREADCRCAGGGGMSSDIRSLVAFARASLPWRWGMWSARPGSTEPSGLIEESRSTWERKEVM